MSSIPRKVKRLSQEKTNSHGFPVDHFSTSSMVKFSTDPFMFKVNYLNGESIDTTVSPGNVLGKAMHKAIQVYLGGNKEVATSANEGEAIKQGHDYGLKYINEYADGFIEYNKTIQFRAALLERYAYAYFQFIKEFSFDSKKNEVLMVEKMLKHTVEIDGKLLPVPLKGAPDLVYKNSQGKIWIEDYKIVAKYSDEDKIDGAKLLQAAFGYFLVYAETGERPHGIVFREFKHVPNKDGSPQTRRFSIVYSEHPLLFDFFFRLYEDVSDALMGKQVYVPNLYALFDREVALISYIHRLDDSEERAKAFKEMKVKNITDFLKKRIQAKGSEKKYLETVSAKFISGKTLNYKTMTIEERIKMKLAEHGLGVEFDSKIEGPSVTLYRFEPAIGLKMSKIEAYVKDIEQVVKSSNIRILAPIPDSGLIGFEVPNKQRTFISNAPSSRNLRVPVGVDVQGDIRYISIKDAPHVLIAGSAGSGKSVLLNSMLRSIGGSADLWLMDPKQVELQDIPHERYADTTEDIAQMLEDLVELMEQRYAEMKKRRIKLWDGRVVIGVIDELADLILSKGEINKKELERMLVRLAQKSRAAGIHLILATQRPSVNVITGLIKANFPTRIVLRTASQIDSQVVIDQKGAEKLLGKGDMLLMDSSSPGLLRLQGYSN